MLQRVHTLLTGGRRELRDVKYMSDLKIRDHDVNAAQAFSAGGLPALFKGDKNAPIFTGLETGGPKARFPNIPTFARFGETNDHDAMRHKIRTGLADVHKTMQHDIDADLVSPGGEIVGVQDGHAHLRILPGSDPVSIRYLSRLFIFVWMRYQDLGFCLSML